MKRYISLALGLICAVASIFLGITSNSSYKEARGTNLLFASSDAIGRINNYIYFLIAACMLGLVAVIALIVFNIQLNKYRKLNPNPVKKTVKNNIPIQPAYGQPVQNVEQVQQSVPVQQAEPVQQPAPVQQAESVQQSAPVQQVEPVQQPAQDEPTEFLNTTNMPQPATSQPIQTNNVSETEIQKQSVNAFCVSCGAKLPDGAMFCTVCGSKVEN